MQHTGTAELQHCSGWISGLRLKYCNAAANSAVRCYKRSVLVPTRAVFVVERSELIGCRAYPGNCCAWSSATGCGDVTSDISDALTPSTTSSRASPTGRSRRGMLRGAASQDHRPLTFGIIDATRCTSSDLSPVASSGSGGCASEGS